MEATNNLLPGYATFILENHLTGICTEQLKLSYEYSLPLLKHLSQFSDQEIITISEAAVSQFLKSLVDGNGTQFIEQELARWIQDQMEIVGKFQIDAEDITLINFIRSRSLKQLLPSFTNNVQTTIQLVTEIDLFFLQFDIKGINTYIQILKERIDKETTFNSRLTDALPGMVFIYNLDRKKEVYCNNKRYQLLGYEGDIPNDDNEDFFSAFIHPDDAKVLEELLHGFNGETNGEVKTFEYRLRNMQQEYRWLRNYVMVFSRNQSKKPIDIIGIAFDVTNEKNLYQRLAKSEEQLLEAQSIASLGSYEWDIEKNTSVNSPELYKIFEMNESTRFETFMAHVHPDDKERVDKALQVSMQTGDYECEYRYLAPSGEKVIWSKGRVTFDDGTPKKMLGTIQDITIRKRIETDLLQKTIQLQQSNANLQHFASTASHDLKEPLRKISLLSERLLLSEKDNLSEVARENFEKIKSASGRLQQLIEDILTFSSVTSNQVKHLSPLNEILEEVKEMFEHTLIETNTTIYIDDLPAARVIPSQIRQVFQNLLANSIKFARKDVDPVITVSHRFTKNTVGTPMLELIFTDNGIGFEPSFAQQIFGLFNRLNNTSEYPGSGIGLAICKRIAENHDGYITAESNLGKGASFHLFLPV